MDGAERTSRRRRGSRPVLPHPGGPRPDARPWALDTLLEGGADGAAWGAALEAVDAGLARLAEARPADPEGWRGLLADFGPLDDRLALLHAVATCEHALDTRRVGPLAEVEGRVRGLEALRSRWRRALGALSDAVFEGLVGAVEPEDRPLLRRWRASPPVGEPGVSLEGATAHMRAYQAALAGVRVEADLEDRGPVNVRLAAVPALQREVSERARAELHDAVIRARREIEPLCCEALLAVTRARREDAERSGVGTLERSLRENRVSAASLGALWEACDRMAPYFRGYLARKAALLGKARLDWWDLVAPDALADGDDGPISWGEACARVIDAHAAFDEEMAGFSAAALAGGWVHHEAGPYARPGAFCIPIEAARQSRVRVRFTGRARDAYTLAHELGHAWHADRLAGEPRGAREAPRALAETASSFSEALVRDRWESPAGRSIRTIESAFAKTVLQRIVFDFEADLQQLGEAVGPEALNARMEAIQRRHLGDTVRAFSPNNWVAMGRLFDVDGAFYNWPHAFGALFSAAVEAHLRGLPSGARGDAWRELLRRTGADRAEDIARELLGADLAAPGFWYGAFTGVRESVDRLLGETGGSVRTGG